ncbi:unnamed protein product [Dicrocoelium dendriticum]|nr:unnamed protein product [Dicrocoelium dendriticum]
MSEFHRSFTVHYLLLLFPAQVLVAIINNIITFVPLLVVTYIFRNSRLRDSHERFLRETVEDHLDEALDFSAGNVTETQDAMEEWSWTEQAPPSLKSSKNRQFRSFPWQMRILAWILLILSLCVAVVFTTFYGVSFGDAACQKWLTSLFLSFFASVILVQPFKVIAMAMFVSFACKDVNRVGDIEAVGEEYALIRYLGRRYQRRMDEKYRHGDFLKRNYAPHKLAIQTPSSEELERARDYRIKHRRARDIIREIFFYLLFLIVLHVVTLSFRDPYGFHLKSNIERTFFKDSFDKVSNAESEIVSYKPVFRQDTGCQAIPVTDGTMFLTAVGRVMQFTDRTAA